MAHARHSFPRSTSLAERSSEFRSAPGPWCALMPCHAGSRVDRRTISYCNGNRPLRLYLCSSLMVVFSNVWKIRHPSPAICVNVPSCPHCSTTSTVDTMKTESLAFGEPLPIKAVGKPHLVEVVKDKCLHCCSRFMRSCCFESLWGSKYVIGLMVLTCTVVPARIFDTNAWRLNKLTWCSDCTTINWARYLSKKPSRCPSQLC